MDENNLNGNAGAQGDLAKAKHRGRRWAIGLALAALIPAATKAVAYRLRRQVDREAGEVLSEPLGEKGHYVKSFDGTRLYTEEVGEGPTLVLVHGWFCNTDMWHYQKKLLADRFRMVCFDQRGHRRSDCPDGKPFTLEELGKDLKAVLDDCAVDRPVVLVGHSMGGMSILKFLELYPEEMGKRVKGVALVDTSNVPMRETITGGQALSGLQKPVVEPAFRWVTDHPGFSESAKNMLVHTAPFLVATRYLGYGSGASLTHMEYIQEMAGKTSIKGACQAGLGLLCNQEPMSLEALKRSGIPVLIWVGEKDKLTRPEVSIRMKEQLEDAVLRVVPDTGHPSYMEEYADFNRELVELAQKSFAG
ncbi:MAG: alpha/beta fold hydrolase [Candidatus Geothermincolia bacterium]